MTHEGRVSIPARDGPVRVDDEGTERKGALGKWTRACARRIEDGDHPFIRTSIAVDRTDCVNEPSRHRPTRVYGVGSRPLAGACARTRRIEDGEAAILGPDETVPRVGRVTAESYDCPRWVDAGGIGALKGARAPTWRVKGGNGLRRQWDGYCQGDQDGCRRHELESPCGIGCFHTY